MRDRLIELMKMQQDYGQKWKDFNRDHAYETVTNEQIADYLLANGVIVPPCNVGDKMYKLCSVNSNIKMGQMWDGKIVKTNCDRCGYKNCSCYDIGLRERDKDYFIDVIEEKTIGSLDFLVKIIPYVGTVWFSTREEAERALRKENKGK